MAHVIRPLMHCPRWHRHSCSLSTLHDLLRSNSLLAAADTAARLVSSSRRYLHFRSPALKRPNAAVPSDLRDRSREESDSDAKKSRNEKKREAQRAVRWGMDLASFSTPKIKRILRVASLEPEVFEAIMLVKKLGRDVREGKRRQFNLIGRLLREAEPELMDGLIQATKDGDQRKFQALSGPETLAEEDDEVIEDTVDEDEDEGAHSYIDRANRWFEGLINKDVDITKEIYSVQDVDFDRQELRRLVREVHNVQEKLVSSEKNDGGVDAALIGAKKSLTGFLRTLSKQLPRVSSGTFTLLNNCDYPVWPGILSNAGISQLSTTGFVLQTGQSKSINTPSNWGGRMWGRTHCAQNQSTGEFSCVTGDCGTGKIECAGNNALPPATLFEITLDGYGGLSFYDVSLVDGYNLPMLVVPQGGTGDNCSTTGCAADLNGLCPSELSVTDSQGDGVVACKSACEKFGSSEYCCSGAYATPNTCKPSSYSELFKRACPLAYSYAYDDKTSTFTCAGADYLITFCPSPSTSQKSSSGSQTPVTPDSPATATPSSVDSTMVYEGALDSSSASSLSSSPSTFLHVFRSHPVAGAVAIVSALWRLMMMMTHHL
ncbi:hypothetical protein RHMOL_Rhmol06G0028500 [Rhododendron molle]|uniref:Uncharacterized protein n=1 Tax=Rhododendron molle TaxID=49168 RepID=A0ACC0N8H9_RHOML|nr:hypothetical protein RHMOL_Rhmol06G0028500 [Rhododendron molle]